MTRAAQVGTDCPPHGPFRRHPDFFECMSCGDDVGWSPLSLPRQDRTDQPDGAEPCADVSGDDEQVQSPPLGPERAT